MAGKIEKISENKYIWTVNNCTSYSPNFLIRGYRTRLILTKYTSNGNLHSYEVKSELDSKIASTTGVKYAISTTFLESDFLLDTKNIFESTANNTSDRSTKFVLEKKFTCADLCNTPVKIKCEFFNLTVEPATQIVPSKCNPAEVLDQKLGKEFQGLLDSGMFSDLSIISKGIEFQVHKNILSARSKVFAAMLKDGTRESKENKIEIDDIDGDLMKEVLKFIYAGEVTNIDKLAYELVTPADKYEINALLDLCELTLLKDISLDNITPILTLINLYDLPLLKSEAFKILKDNPEFVKSKDFNNFLKKLNPALLVDMITYVG